MDLGQTCFYSQLWPSQLCDLELEWRGKSLPSLRAQFSAHPYVGLVILSPVIRVKWCTKVRYLSYLACRIFFLPTNVQKLQLFLGTVLSIIYLSAMSEPCQRTVKGQAWCLTQT